MDPTHNVGKFLRLLEWFSEAQLLYPKIRNYKEVGCLLSNCRKKQILWNYAFDLFKGEIHNMNKTRCGYFHTYTEAKSVFILAEERKASKTKKAQKLRSQKKIVLDWLTLKIIKLKSLSRKKTTSRVIPTLAQIKYFPRSAPTAESMVTSQLNALNPPGGELQR